MPLPGPPFQGGPSLPGMGPGPHGGGPGFPGGPAGGPGFPPRPGESDWVQCSLCYIAA